MPTTTAEKARLLDQLLLHSPVSCHDRFHRCSQYLDRLDPAEGDPDEGNEALRSTAGGAPRIRTVEKPLGRRVERMVKQGPKVSRDKRRYRCSQPKVAGAAVS